MGEMRIEFKTPVGKPEEKKNLGEMGVDGRIILK
jgi:hypothetical protein